MAMPFLNLHTPCNMAEVRHRRQPAARAPVAPVSTYPEKKRRRRFHPSLPRAWVVVLGFLAFYATSFGVVTYWHTWLPAAKGLDTPPSDFSEARARAVLEQIMSFGYRPVGTKANEELTPQYLLEQVRQALEGVHAVEQYCDIVFLIVVL
jgi:hypothetical protein